MYQTNLLFILTPASKIKKSLSLPIPVQQVAIGAKAIVRKELLQPEVNLGILHALTVAQVDQEDILGAKLEPAPRARAGGGCASPVSVHLIGS